MADAADTPDQAAATAPAGTVTGHCLTCGAPHPLIPGGAVSGHFAARFRDGACAGSLHRSAQLDGLDDERRAAIGHQARLRAQADQLRAEFAQQLLGRISLADLIEMDAAAVIPLEAEAELWAQVAWHGDLWKTAAEVLPRVAGSWADQVSGFDRATLELRLVGQRRWLRSALLDRLTEAGPGVFELLYGVLLTMPT